VLKDPNVDYVFMGHAEERVEPFLESVLHGDAAALRDMGGVAFRDNGEVVNTPLESFPADIRAMVKPDYSLLDLDLYLGSQDNLGSHHLAGRNRTATIISSYGCPNHCLFCANPLLSRRRVAFRPIEDVIEEIEFLHTAHGVDQFVFIDDCFLLKKSRVRKLLDQFIDWDYDFTWKTSSVPAWLLDEELLQLMKRSGCTRRYPSRWNPACSGCSRRSSASP
jgi:radical SAM superfamily enzyme YgiQ (UPF0313 family)